MLRPRQVISPVTRQQRHQLFACKNHAIRRRRWVERLLLALLSQKSTVPQNLNAADQASFDEIMKRSGSSEVVVIVRPKAPGGQSEIITLDNASPELVHALEARQRGTQAPLTK